MAWYSLFNVCRRLIIKLFFQSVETRQDSSEKITAVELKRLLVNITSYNSNVFFRCRQMGAMWMTRHAMISSVTGNSVLLYDEKDSKYTYVDINSIIQFDLDERFQHYLPHYHYDVEPSSELVTSA